ncbi:sulfatase/phosphatase domain-containing protein, partial [Planctomycetota bacterium]
QYKKRFLDAGYDERAAGRYGMIENIDDNMGLLWTKLNEWKALENTLIIFMTDNGMSPSRMNYKGKRFTPYNAGMRGHKGSSNEGGTHVPAFWYWQGVLGEGVDIDALTAHIDLYRTFTELAGAKLPVKMQSMDGRSLLPLLENPKADWPDRELFVHYGRWNPGRRDASKYRRCAVRTERWRFVNNAQLYDISADPNETTDVSGNHPEVVKQLRQSYDQWWESVKPMMVNEDLPSVKEHPLHIRYNQQLESKGIPEWAPSGL